MRNRAILETLYSTAIRASELMMEHGADHERLTTTQIYTHVSIQRLQEVHARTHPASRR